MKNRDLGAGKRDVGIDALRGLSILAVIVYHYGYFSLGLYGVLLFFMISGYCMTPSVGSCSTVWQFIRKRWTRLLPALIACTVISSTVEFFLPVEGRGQTLKDIALMFTCMPLADIPCRFMKAQYVPTDGTYWSLIVEFKFYAVLAFVYFVISRRHFYYVMVGLVGVSYFAMLLFSRTLRSEFVAYLPYFLAGMALYQHKIGNRTGAVIGIAVSVSVYLLFHFGVQTVSIPPSWTTLAAFVACIIILPLAVRFGPKIQNTVPMRGLLFLGLISYPLYLLHYDISLAAFSVIGSSWIAKAAAITAIAGVAYLVNRYVENTRKKPIQTKGVMAYTKTC